MRSWFIVSKAFTKSTNTTNDSRSCSLRSCRAVLRGETASEHDLFLMQPHCSSSPSSRTIGLIRVAMMAARTL